MPRDSFITAGKLKIDNKEFKNRLQLRQYLQDAEDDQERQILSDYFNSKNAGGPGAFSPAITKIDFQQLGEAPFDENKDAYFEFSPQYWFKYFWTELRKEKLGPKEIDLGLEAVQLLFNKVQDGGLSRGFRLKLKDDMVPTKGAPLAAGEAPQFGLSQPAAQAWNKALTNLLEIGFRAVPATVDALETPTEHAMLEKQFVVGIKKQSVVRVFWRADSRGKTAFKEGAKRSVDDAEACGRYGLNQPWHPFSKEENKKFLWFRRGQADNDFYTVVSVTAEVETAVTFPLIDERRAYQMPLKPLAQWSEQELMANRKHVAEVEIEGAPGTTLLIGTTTNVFMLAINGGVVLETRCAGAFYRGEDKGFPEAGVKGYPFEAFMGHIPVIRVHHDCTNAGGFTAFLNPSDSPLFYLTLTALEHRFGENGAMEVQRQFKSIGITKLNKLVTAWSSYGATTVGVPLNIKRLVSFPASEIRVRSFVKTKR